MMKKLALSLFIVLIVSSAHAQFRLGLTASPAVSWLKTDNKYTKNTSVVIGLNYGLLFDYTLGKNERYAFSSGFQVMMNGGVLDKKDTTVGSIDTIYHMNLQYVNIPITLRLRTNEIGYITYYGQFGITPALNVRARGKTEYGSTIIDKENYNKSIELFNVSLAFGAGIEYSLSDNTSLLAGLFFDNGILTVVKKKFFNDTKTQRTIANSAGIKLGIFF